MTARKRVGIPPHLYCDPLRGAPGATSPFSVETGDPARLAIALRERKLDLAFLTPIDYARDGSLYYVVPDVAALSERGTGTITLHFPTDIPGIRTLAADPSSSSEIVLAQILLGEQFNIHPRIVPASGTLEQMLGKADAALLVGDASLRAGARNAQMIDLVEEWFEMTGLPFVHGIWCGREQSADAGDLATFARLRTAGTDGLASIAAAAKTGHNLALDDRELQGVLEGFDYLLSEEGESGLSEFLRFAYYHGVLPDVVDLQYFDPSAAPGGDAEASPGAPVR